MGKFVNKDDEKDTTSPSHSGLDMSGVKDDDWTLQLWSEEVEMYFKYEKIKDTIPMLDTVTRR